MEMILYSLRGSFNYEILGFCFYYLSFLVIFFRVRVRAKKVCGQSVLILNGKKLPTGRQKKKDTLSAGWGALRDSMKIQNQ